MGTAQFEGNVGSADIRYVLDMEDAGLVDVRAYSIKDGTCTMTGLIYENAMRLKLAIGAEGTLREDDPPNFVAQLLLMTVDEYGGVAMGRVLVEG